MLRTVTGTVDEQSAGRILEHEHILVGFVEDGKLTRNDYNEEDVVARILPLLQPVKDNGCHTFVDASPSYMGRDPRLLLRLSLESGVHIVTNTGLYKAPYLPPYAHWENEEQLAARWIKEAEHGIEDTGVLPGFIKIALNDGERIDAIQQKILRAAMRASLETGLPIQCHAVGCGTALHAHEIMAQAGFPQDRFIWIHAQTCGNLEIHQRLADAGVWISIDSILPDLYETHTEQLQRLIRLGIGDRILLSQDTGWYHVGQPNGGQIHPYHLLFTGFLPFACDRGLDRQWLERCLTTHAFQALSIRTTDM